MTIQPQAIAFALWSTLAFAGAQTPQQPPPHTELPTQTLHTGTQLVVLDATVFDRAGHIVTQPLTRDDFLIVEDKRPQTIRTFEAPAEHMPAADSAAGDKAPHTIFVLDELNSRYLPQLGDKANLVNLLDQQVYLRNELIAFLRRQPPVLDAPAEILTLTHHGYAELVPATRDRDSMIAIVARHDPGLGSPFRDYIEETGYGGSADHTLTRGSMSALWSLALAQRSQPGRKNVIWLGWGGPDHFGDARVDPKHPTSFERYVRQITDLLVEARITVNVMGPGAGRGSDVRTNSLTEQLETHNFENDFGFSGYVTATGGRFSNGNDVTGEIATAVNYGAQFYTIGYKPENDDFDGRFRRIRVSIAGHPEWTVLTKAGYYAMQFGGEKDLDHELQSDLSIATFEAMPFHAIGATLTSIERLRGTDIARFTLLLQPNDLDWVVDADSGRREAEVAVSAAALGSVFANKPLNSKVGTWKLSERPESADAPPNTTVNVLARIPPKTRLLRIVIRDMANGRMGTVDVNPAMVAKAPLADPASPTLQPRSP